MEPSLVQAFKLKNKTKQTNNPQPSKKLNQPKKTPTKPKYQDLEKIFQQRSWSTVTVRFSSCGFFLPFYSVQLACKNILYFIAANVSFQFHSDK